MLQFSKLMLIFAPSLRENDDKTEESYYAFSSRLLFANDKTF